MSKSVAIGLTNLYYSIVLNDWAANDPEAPSGMAGKTEYDTPIRLAGAITANFSPNASNDTLFADDGPYDTASTLGAMSLELNVADLPAVHRATLLGAKYENGLLTSSAADVPPYVAVGMSVLKSNGASRMIWYLKGKFTAPDENNQTKADSINWNTPTITGNFLKRDSDDLWRYSADTDDATAPANLMTEWFAEGPSAARMATLFAGGGTVATPVLSPASGTVYTPGTTVITASCATAGATLTYTVDGGASQAYTTGIDTTGWTGSKTVVVTAAKSGMTSATATGTYSDT